MCVCCAAVVLPHCVAVVSLLCHLIVSLLCLWAPECWSSVVHLREPAVSLQSASRCAHPAANHVSAGLSVNHCIIVTVGQTERKGFFSKQSFNRIFLFKCSIFQATWGQKIKLTDQTETGFMSAEFSWDQKMFDPVTILTSSPWIPTSVSCGVLNSETIFTN